MISAAGSCQLRLSSMPKKRWRFDYRKPFWALLPLIERLWFVLIGAGWLKEWKVEDWRGSFSSNRCSWTDSINAHALSFLYATPVCTRSCDVQQRKQTSKIVHFSFFPLCSGQRENVFVVFSHEEEEEDGEKPRENQPANVSNLFSLSRFA